LRCRVAMIEPFGRRGMQQEFVVYEVQLKVPIIGEALSNRRVAARIRLRSSVIRIQWFDDQTKRL
jgi:hypothetical protein